MSTLSETTRDYVRHRASNRCEYCLSHQDYIMGRLQIDHIYPVSKGGTDDEVNLCLACELCNQHKWTQTDGIDPQTNTLVTLFNPRLNYWSDHFTWSSDSTEIIGLTPCGRATVVALRFNNSLAVTVRNHWVRAGWHPPVDFVR